MILIVLIVIILLGQYFKIHNSTFEYFRVNLICDKEDGTALINHLTQHPHDAGFDGLTVNKDNTFSLENDPDGNKNYNFNELKLLYQQYNKCGSERTKSRN